MIDLFSVKFFKLFFGAIVAIEILSLIANFLPNLATVLFLTVSIVAIILTYKNLEAGALLLLGELFIGGKGYLLSGNIGDYEISLRMSLFVIFFGIWAIKRLPKILRQPLADSYIQKTYLTLVLAIFIGAILGYFNNPTTWLKDFNAWIFFATLIPLLDIFKLQDLTQKVINLLFAAASYLSLKTISLLILFAFAPTNIINFFYRWVRDTGVGETTHVTGTIFRIFMQSQIYVLIALGVALAILIINWKTFDSKQKKFYGIFCYLTSLAIIISQSRSFWVGLAGGVTILLVLAWYSYNFSIKKIIGWSAVIIFVLASHALALQLLTGNFSGLAIKDRLSDVQGEAAGISRLNQLKPLLYATSENFLFGKGFGSQITYQSNDPRILKNNPDGLYTTYAFEWGYLDIWLKLGIIGLVIYLWLLAVLAFRAYQEKTALGLGLLIGLIALMATHMFSPYLNHPLGIGYVVLLTAIYNKQV
jgi:O-antigen ligase